MITRRYVLPYPMAALFDLAADIESYPAFLPNCVAARVEGRDADGSWRVDNVFRWGTFTTRFRTRARFDPPHSILVVSEEKKFPRFQINWHFSPSGEEGGDGTGTAIAFTLEPALPPGLRRLARFLIQDHAAEIESRFIAWARTKLGDPA